jgi:hypothetical protein
MAANVRLHYLIHIYTLEDLRNIVMQLLYSYS